MQKINVSIGVFAHNEESNIEKTLASIISQDTDIVSMKEILVISSGSNDKTNSIVRRIAKKDKRVTLFEEFQRKGKSSAVNLFIRKSKSQILVTVSSDLRLSRQSIEEICLPFLHKDIGMVGAHPKPSNIAFSKVGKEMSILWDLHHIVSLQHPKCGEMVAFRKVIHSIPFESAVDEATIEILLKLIGYKVVYAPRAIVYNRAPNNIKELIIQRRRIYTGHTWVNEKYNYPVSTMERKNVYRAILEYLAKNPQNIIHLIKLVIIEVLARILGWIDFYIFNKNPYVWKMVKR